jgi:hypothetical protein
LSFGADVRLFSLVLDLPIDSTSQQPAEMRLNSKILGLPASMLFFIASQATSAQSGQDDQSLTEWPWNLPKHVRYWPEDPPHRRRDLEAIAEHLSLGRSPVGVMKMSPDEGEKFYMEYWQFEGPLEQ